MIHSFICNYLCNIYCHFTYCTFIYLFTHLLICLSQFVLWKLVNAPVEESTDREMTIPLPLVQVQGSNFVTSGPVQVVKYSLCNMIPFQIVIMYWYCGIIPKEKIIEHNNPSNVFALAKSKGLNALCDRINAPTLSFAPISDQDRISPNNINQTSDDNKGIIQLIEYFNILKSWNK